MKRLITAFLALAATVAVAAYAMRKLNEALGMIGEVEYPDDPDQSVWDHLDGEDLPEGVDGFRPTPQRDEG